MAAEPVTETRPDAEDVALAAGGDTGAFERLYRRHEAYVHSLARRMIGPGDADDATQEIFIRVWKGLHTFREDAAFRTWLHRVALNLILTRRERRARRRKRYLPGEDVIRLRPAPRATPGLAVDFEAAIEALPDGAREVFVLHDVEGYKHREIAEQLGVAVGTSKSQLHRARTLLRESLS